MFYFVKIKVYCDRVKDFEIVIEIRRVIGDDILIVIDVNMSWSFIEVVEYVRKFCEVGLMMVEELFLKRFWIELYELCV